MTPEVVVIVVSAFVIGAAAIAIIHNAVRARRPPRSAMEAPKLTAEDQQQQIAEAEAVAKKALEKEQQCRARLDAAEAARIAQSPSVLAYTHCPKCRGEARSLRYVAAISGRVASSHSMLTTSQAAFWLGVGPYLPATPEHIIVTCATCGHETTATVADDENTP